MAKRESIWKANDGTEHRSKQSAAVADAEHDVFEVWDALGVGDDPSKAAKVLASTVLDNLTMVADALSAVIKARVALAKHEAKGEK